MKINYLKEADKLIISGKGKVTEKQGRLDFPERLPICFELQLSYCRCPGYPDCLFGLLGRYRNFNGFSVSDIAISCPYISCSCSNKNQIITLPKSVSSDLMYYPIDNWREEDYQKALPWILSLYKSEHWEKLWEGRYSKKNARKQNDDNIAQRDL